MGQTARPRRLCPYCQTERKDDPPCVSDFAPPWPPCSACCCWPPAGAPPDLPPCSCRRTRLPARPKPPRRSPPRRTLCPKPPPRRESAPLCTDAGLTLALDGCLAYEADSAGGSLKTAIAADGLVRCLACYGGSEADLTACAVRWHDGLDAEEQALLALNWPGVRGTARSITDSDEAVRGLLADAGVDGDYTGVDLPAAADGMDALDAVLAAPEQPEK